MHSPFVCIGEWGRRAAPCHVNWHDDHRALCKSTDVVEEVALALAVAVDVACGLVSAGGMVGPAPAPAPACVAPRTAC